jgi:hypothetical protein
VSVRGVKRQPAIPAELRDVYHRASKADLAEAAISLAALATGSADDLDAGARRLLAEINALRQARGAAVLTPHSLDDFD